MSDRVATEVVVRGRVQGVFFRDGCRGEARSAGVAGWVRNESDGSVRARFEGVADAVDRCVTWVRQGPPQAQVDGVEVHDVPVEELDGFEVR
jgi:acylphosphatase